MAPHPVTIFFNVVEKAGKVSPPSTHGSDRRQVVAEVRRTLRPSMMSVVPTNRDILSGPFFCWQQIGSAANRVVGCQQQASATIKTRNQFLKCLSRHLSWNFLFASVKKRPNEHERIGGNQTSLWFQESKANLGLFDLSHYFQLKKSGDFKLTVWPKIYKPSSKNQDRYERIDILPVTVVIKWGGTPGK